MNMGICVDTSFLKKSHLGARFLLPRSLPKPFGTLGFLAWSGSAKYFAKAFFFSQRSSLKPTGSLATLTTDCWRVFSVSHLAKSYCTTCCKPDSTRSIQETPTAPWKWCETGDSLDKWSHDRRAVVSRYDHDKSHHIDLEKSWLALTCPH